MRAGVEGDLDRHVLGAAVMIRHEAAGALVGPFHRPSQHAGAVQDADIFRIDAGLHAERAADIAGEHAHFVGARAEDVHQRGLHAHDALARRMQCPFAGSGVEFADGGARLHGGDDHALVGGLQPRDMRGLGEGGGDFLGVAEMVVERQVVRHGIVEPRRARLHGCGGAEHRGERFDVEDHRLGGVLGLRQGFRDDAGDRIADEADFVGGQRRPRRIADRRAVAVLERQVAFVRAVAGEIGRRVDRQHPRHGLGCGGIDAADDAMGDVAAHHHRIGLPGAVGVVGVAALAPHQSGVFAARHRLTDAEFGQRKRRFGGLVIHAGASNCDVSRGTLQIKQPGRFDKNSFRRTITIGRMGCAPPARC